MKVFLKKGKEKSVLRKHPWIFSGAIEKTSDTMPEEKFVEVVDSRGNFLCIGQFSPHSQIRVRILTFQNQNIDKKFFERRIRDSIMRRDYLLKNSDSARLVYSESDLLPGLIVDNYAGHYVVQYLSMGMEQFKQDINDILIGLPGCKSLYERSDSSSRFKEGLQKVCKQVGTPPTPELVEINENNYKLLADIRRGHKTGFYLDQRVSRHIVAEFSSGKNVLNCFSYTGAFAVAMIKSGAASVTNVDSSGESLILADQNRKINNIEDEKIINIQADVFEYLRECISKGKKYDLIILDPPKFAESAANVLKASRGYKDINRLAFEILNPGGLLATFSCSAHINRQLFQKIVADAALDAGKNVHIIETLTQSPDHPVLLSFPEAEYLKGFICRVL